MVQTNIPMVRDVETGEMRPMDAGLLDQLPQHQRPQEQQGTAPFRPPIDFAAEAQKRQKLSRAELLEAIRPQRMGLYVDRFNANVYVEAMTAGEYDQHAAMQNTVVRLKRDGTAEYDAKLNQMRAGIVCDHTYWEDGSKVFDQPTDPMTLAQGDNAIVSLLFGGIDEMSSTTTEQLEAAKNASKKTLPMR